MNLLLSLRAEVLKSNRTASFYICLVMAAFIPALLIFDFYTDLDHLEELRKDPWGYLLQTAWQNQVIMFLPMYLLLICSMLPQIEYRNNAWKQVFVTPQSLGQIFLAKHILVQAYLLTYLVIYNVLMLVAAFICSLNMPDVFAGRTIDWQYLLVQNARAYISLLGLSAVLFWLGWRIRNFIVPIGIGFGLWIAAGMLIFEVKWQGAEFLPSALPVLNVLRLKDDSHTIIGRYGTISLAYYATFLILGYFDFVTRRSKV